MSLLVTGKLIKQILKIQSQVFPASCKLFPYISSGCSSDPTADLFLQQRKYSRKLFINIDSSSLMQA